MNIHEYQAKEILSTFGIPVPRGRVALTADQVERAAKEMGGRCVVKAQIYAGGRGKAGGVKLVHHPEQAQDLAKELFGKTLVTPQTGPEGLKVRRILVEEAVDIAREFYLSITLDRGTSRYILIASAEGGMEIEEVATRSPEKIHTLTIDPFTGLRSFQARHIALQLGLSGSVCEDCVSLILNLYRVCLEKDCALVEINPLVVTRAGWLMAMDAKITFDDNAIFRHREYPDMMDYSQLDPLEINAGKYDLAYIKLTGTIGCLVNGAGLAMATLDVLKEFGGEPANFLDVGGGGHPREGGRGVQDHPSGQRRERDLRQHLRRDHALRRDRPRHHRGRQRGELHPPHSSPHGREPGRGREEASYRERPQRAMRRQPWGRGRANREDAGGVASATATGLPSPCPSPKGGGDARFRGIPFMTHT